LPARFRYGLIVSDSLLHPRDKDARIASLEAPLAERDASLAEAKAELLHRDLLIETMRVQLVRLRRMQFGASSEKLNAEIEQLELALEELEAAAPVAQASTVPPKPERPSPVRALPDHPPREDVVAEPSSGTCTCPDCGGILRKLGDDSAEQLDVAPVQWRVVRTIRPKYSCRSCDKIVQAPAPVKAIARGKATFATLAHIIVSKFDHHLPLYRQSEVMAKGTSRLRRTDRAAGMSPEVAQGVDIDRSTLAGWTGQASALLDPIISRLSPKSVMALAIAYGTKRWTALTLFLDNGSLEIDNNIAERSLRSVAVGRKNWLFAGSKTGGDRAAAIYTVIETCKMNNIEPQAYIADVITKIANGWPASRWDELMPWNWKRHTDVFETQAA
jgi:transposase